MADIFNGDSLGGTEQTLSQLVSNTNANYDVAIKYYEAREKMFLMNFFNKKERDMIKIEDFNKLLQKLLSNVKNKIIDLEKTWLSAARRIGAGESYQKVIGDYNVNDFKKYGYKIHFKKQNFEVGESLLEAITPGNKGEVATLHENITAQIIVDEFEKVFTTGLSDATKNVINSNIERLIGLVTGGIEVEKGTGIRNKYKQVGTDATFFIGGHGIDLYSTLRFVKDKKGNTKSTGTTMISHGGKKTSLSSVVEAAIGIDLQNQTAENLLNQVRTTTFSQDQQLFDLMYGSQQKYWNYNRKSGINEEKWMQSSKFQQHFQNLFNQINEDGTQPTWVDEYALNYVAWGLSRYLLNIVGIINIFFVAGDTILPMSTFLKENMFYMSLITRNKSRIYGENRKIGVSSADSASKEAFIRVPSNEIRIRSLNNNSNR